MYSPVIRIIIGILGLTMAWKFYSNGDMETTYLLLAAVALVIWGYFKNGTVYMAFRQLKRENYNKAERLLLKTKYPNLLKRGQKSYYHFTKGFIELNRQNLDASYSEFKKALEIGLRTENDTSIVTINLAAIELERNNYEEAKKYIVKAKTFNNKPELQSEIEKVEESYKRSLPLP